IIRQQVSDLLVICPRQYDLKKRKSKEGTILGEKEEQENQCNYKGKIKEIKDHLDKQCQLISIQHIILLIKELQLQLQIEKLKADELKEMHLKSNTEIQQLNKIDYLQHESVKKNAQIIELTNDIQQIKSEINQNITKLKKKIEQCQSTCNSCTKLNDEIKHLKLEKEINEKKQNKEISKMNNDNQILKQQRDNILTEIKQLKKETQFKNNQIYHHFNPQLLQTKSNSSSKFNFDLFHSSFKLINTFTGHTNWTRSIDYSTFGDCQFICSGSYDKTVRVWDVDKNKQIQSFNGHSYSVCCVKFSLYHYHNYRQHVICSSSLDKTIRFWNFKHNQQLKIFDRHTDC
ncbi:WD-repeat protein, partial [Reticulomyxa filosa]